MEREFVYTDVFTASWRRMGLTEDDTIALEELLLADQQAGDVIPGLHGARKVRIQASSHGKRGGGRVIYVDVVVQEKIYLLLAYPKNELENLTNDQKKTLASIIRTVKGEI